MIIGSIKEQNPEETRVPLTPLVVKSLTTAGHTVFLEKNIGSRSFFSNKEYRSAGARFSLTPEEIYPKSHIILQILPPMEKHIKLLTKKQIIAADFRNFNTKKLPPQIRILRLEHVPRTSVAQSIDILSTQDTVRGYASALYALSHSLRIAPQLMTAAVSLKPAMALVIGAGITGLQAASVFKKNGCRVTILDINEQAKELATSVGADFAIASTSKELNTLVNNKNFILATASSSSTGKSPAIIPEKTLKYVAPQAVIVDTTTQNIGIKEKNIASSAYFFHRNLYFERLIPQTSSELWANNMFNLINLISAPDNTLNLSPNYISPMLCSKPEQTNPNSPHHKGI